MKKIEIIEGHNPSSYFWIQPAVVADSDIIEYDNITLLNDEISIEETDVDCFLYYFFDKYFDLKLYCNKKLYDRVVSGDANLNGFEWYLTDNFYTYDSIRNMLCEILEVADLLEKDFNNGRLDEVKKKFSIFYMCEKDDSDYINANNSNEAFERHKDVVISFYRRFVSRMNKMLDDNPQSCLISICGP